RRRHGQHIFPQPRRHACNGALVSLCHHVRGPVHPVDSRCGHARWPLHAAGGAGTRVETFGPHQRLPQCADYERPHRGRMGILSMAGSARPAGRNQFIVAAVRDSQPVARGGGVLRGDNYSDQKAEDPVCGHHSVPLLLLVAVNFTAAYEKIFNPNPRIGFLAQASQLAASGGNARLVFNWRLDAVVTGLLVVMVALILIESGREWLRVLTGRKDATVKEAPFVMTRFVMEEQG